MNRKTAVRARIENCLNPSPLYTIPRKWIQFSCHETLVYAAEEDVPEEFSSVFVKHDITPAESEAEKELHMKVQGLEEKKSSLW